MASGNFTGNSPVSTNLYVTWSSTPNNTNNTSSVTVNLYMRHYALYATSLSGSYLSVAGNSTAYSKSISYGGSSQTTTLLTSKTVTVNHNSDGTGSCNITGTFVLNGRLSGQYVGTITASQVVTLDAIPRASSVTKITNSSGTTISSIDSGAGIRVYWTPASSAFKYRIQCVVSGNTYTYPSISTFYSPGSTSSYYASITTAHSWLPNDPSKQVSVKLYTYNSGGTQIGDVRNAAFTLNVPSAIMPTIGTFTATVVDGINGYYVQGKSKVRLSVTATKGNGATNIVAYTFNGKNITGTASSVRVNSTATTYSLNSGILNFASTENYSVTVTDSRNRSTTMQLASPIRVYPYSPPAISSITVSRCTSNGTPDSSGTYAYVTVNSAYSSINNQNKLTVRLSSSLDNYAAVTTVQNEGTIDTYSGVYGNGSFSIGSTYTIRATIIDKSYSNTAIQNATLTTATRPLNILSTGDGVAIGKMAETSDVFDVGWDTLIRGDLYVGSEISPSNKISGMANYLPLSGGTMTGALRLNSYLSFPNTGAALKVTNDLMGSGSSYGRTMELGNENGAGDRYYLQVDSNHNLKLGTRLNNLPSITWQGITSSQFRHGYCTLNTSSAVTVSFASSFPGVPQVVLTPYTSSGGVIATKIRSITASGFSAIIGGSGFSDIRCEYIAIYN